MNRIARHRRLALAAYVIALFAVTLAPLPSTRDVVEVLPILAPVVKVLDKVVHAVLFGGLALLLFWNFGWTDRRGVVLQATGLAVAGAAAVEVLQSPIPYRQGDFLDFVAGCGGALAVAIIVTALVRRGSRQAPSRDV